MMAPGGRRSGQFRRVMITAIRARPLAPGCRAHDSPFDTGPLSSDTRKKETTMAAALTGQMMQMPLMISSLIVHAARHAADTEIVSKRVEGDLHRYTWAAAEKRS